MASLQADCGQCFGLCCVALPFARSADFAFDKPAGTPCVHLSVDARCGVHAELRERGFRGCAAFDCFGAGQRISQVTFGGRSWRTGDSARMFAAFDVVRSLHELLWYLDDVLTRVPESVRVAVQEAYDRTEALAALPAEAVAGVDVGTHRSSVAGTLRAASAAVRTRGLRRFAAGADLAGADLRGADLSDEELRGACLIAADLSGATLRRTDLIGADLRDTNLADADLSDALYLSNAQLGAARGDAATRLPARLTRPAHWR